MSKKKLIVAVSGGRTSMYMAIKLREQCSHVYDMVFIFANTGVEHEDTLRFLNDAERELGLPLVWVETVVHQEKGKGSTHRVVNYETASRLGEPYEAVIAKYGIPNIAWLVCTRELKLRPIDSYQRFLGWPKQDCERAIGIRIDENRRVSKSATADKIIYPLIDMFPSDKEDVLDYMAQFYWDLRIPEWLGNCVFCYKKSASKLKKAHLDCPEHFEFPNRMEQLYGRSGTYQQTHPNELPSTFFRGKLSTKNLIERFAIEGSTDSPLAHLEDGGCSESCEMYPTEVYAYEDR